MHVLENLGNLYLGEELLEDICISVQAQHRYPVCTTVDQCGEQTINHDAKTAGGIRNIVKDSIAVLKWCLNRSDQRTNTKAIFDMAKVCSASSSSNPLLPSQIIKSEKLVQCVTKVLGEDFVNFFDTMIDQTS